VRYLSIKDVSKLTGISSRTINDWLHRPLNPLPHYRIGKRKGIRIREDELDEWMKQYKTEPGQRIERLVSYTEVS